MEQRRERELRVYQDLLAAAELGTAKHCGSVWDESEGRFWLLLEFVDGMEVRSCDFEYWVAAAAWLGRMQGYFAQHSNRLNGCDFLLRHDTDFFWSVAELALRAVSQISIPLADRVAKIVNRYDRLVDVMVGQPSTLVHGAYLPSQILVDVNSESLRICPIDWELAAFGSPLYDLAFLSDGFESPRLDLLWDAYRQEAEKYDISVPNREEMRFVVDCFRLHKVINWLSQSLDRQYPEEEVAKLVGIGERIGNLVF